jgi:hypothetical protein
MKGEREIEMSNKLIIIIVILKYSLDKKIIKYRYLKIFEINISIFNMLV